MLAILKVVPIARTPRAFYSSLKRAETCCVVGLALALSVLLSGKTRCFGVLAAELQNRTCVAVEATCGVATLNWIVFLAETIAVAGRPLLGALLSRAYDGALGGRLVCQAALALALGACLSGVAADPESLFVTDSLMQGTASALLLVVSVARLAHLFPADHRAHRAAMLLTEVAPWLGVLLCPVFGSLLLAYGWKSTYVLVALLVLVLCVLAAVVEPRAARHKFEGDGDGDDDDDASNGDSDNGDGLKTPSAGPDCWETGDINNTNNHPPNLKQLLLDTDVAPVMSRPVVAVWLVERALFTIAEFGLVVNLVLYMTDVVRVPLYTASVIMVTLGAGNVMGLVTVYVLGPRVRPHLVIVYCVAAVVLVICFVVWHVYGAYHSDLFTPADAHFVVIVIGVFSGAGTAQIHLVAEDVLQRPQIAAVLLTKLAQSIGLLFGPITSGMLIQIDYFHSFFAVQAFIHAVRVVLLAFIHYKQ